MCPLPDLSRSLLALRPASDLNWRSAAQRKATIFLIAADEPEIEKAATLIRSDGAILRRRKAWTSYMRPRRVVRSMPCWLTPAVVLAVAFAKARQVMDTNITGTVYLIHKIGNDMRRRNAGRTLIEGSIAGFIPSNF
jgi:uncharacterized protein